MPDKIMYALFFTVMLIAVTAIGAGAIAGLVGFTVPFVFNIAPLDFSRLFVGVWLFVVLCCGVVSIGKAARK